MKNPVANPISSGKTIFLLLILLAFFFSDSFRAYSQTSPDMKQQFEQKMSEFLGVKVSIEDYQLQFTTVKLRKILIGEKNQPDKPWARIDNLSATCDFMALLGGNLILEDLNLDGMICDIPATLLLEARKKQKIQASSPAIDRSFADLPFLNLSAKEIELKVIDKSRVFNLALESLEITREKGSDKLLAQISGLLSGRQSSKGKPSEFSGKLQAKVNLSGMISAPKVNGIAEIKSLKLQDQLLKQPVSVTAGTLQIFENRVETRNFPVTWGNSKVTISGTASNFKQLQLGLSYRIDPLAFAELSSAFISTKGITVTGTGTSEGVVKGSLSGFSVNGSLSVPLCTIEAPVQAASNQKYVFPFRNLTSSYTYSGNQILIQRARAEIFAGRLAGQGKVFTGTSPVKFEFRVDGTGLRAEKFLSENTTQKNVVSGPVNANLNVSGNSSGLTTLAGSGNFNMQNGHYEAPPVITPMLSLVNLREFASGDIESGKGTFALSNGYLSTNDLVFVARAGKAYYRGQVGLDTSLSGKMTIIFDQEAVRRSSALQQISLDGRSASIPSRVEGTLLTPSFPGFSAQKLLELGLKRKGQRMLQDIFLPRKDKPADQSENQQQQQQEPKKEKPEEKIIEGLKDIFKF